MKAGMAYYAGLVASDGHLEKNVPYITISSKEYVFLKDYVAPIIHEQIDRKTLPYWDKSAKIWKIRIYSRVYGRL